MKLLIVNDEMITADTMKREVAWKTYGIDQVDVVYNAQRAKEFFQNDKCDIVLCDIEMPGENGIELIRWIREQKLDVEVVILTCHASFAYAQDAVRLGVMDYVVIPAPYQVIGEAIYKAVLRWQQEAEKQTLSDYGKQWIRTQKDEATETSGRKKSKEEIASDVKKFVQDNIENENLTVEMIADYCCLNAIYLNRIFKEQTQTSINKYIISERMKLAALLLKGGELSANTVAMRVGYINYPHFSSSFKKYYGCSPAQYIDK